MLTFDEIEDCMPDGDGCWSHDESGRLLVTAQWLHDFAHAIAAKERVAAEVRCGKTSVLLAGHHPYTALSVQTMMMAAVSDRSNDRTVGPDAGLSRQVPYE